MFSGGHRGWQVPGARGVQGEPVRDVHGRDSGTYRGRIPTYSHPPFPGQVHANIWKLSMGKCSIGRFGHCPTPKTYEIDLSLLH